MTAVRAASLLALSAFGCVRAHPAPPPAGPVHGLTYRISGLGATGPVVTWYQFDADRGVLSWYEGPLPAAGEHGPPASRTLEAGEARALWHDARGVLHGARPVTHDVSDFALHLVIRDGDAVLDVSGSGPFAPSPAEQLADEVARLATQAR